MTQNIDSLYCTQFGQIPDDAIFKHNALCSGEYFRLMAVVWLSGHTGHRVFDTVSPESDFIETKSKTEQDKKSGLDKQIQATSTPEDLVSDNQNSIPTFTDEDASDLSANKSNNSNNH